MARQNLDNTTNKNINVSELLVKMNSEGTLRVNNCNSPNVMLHKMFTDNKRKVQNVLELARLIVDNNELVILQNKDSSRKDILDIANAVEKKAMHRMLELEGLDPDVENQVKREKVGGSGKKPFIIGLANRVSAHKKRLQKSSKTKDFNNETL